jgi:cytochrome c-type biogenesis protein CcmH/NrfG
MDSRVLGLQSQVNVDHKNIYAWEQILSERPDYRDGWIQLANLYYQSGDKIEAKTAILKAKELDPNNETVLSFEKFLEN